MTMSCVYNVQYFKVVEQYSIDQKYLINLILDL